MKLSASSSSIDPSSWLFMRSASPSTTPLELVSPSRTSSINLDTSPRYDGSSNNSTSSHNRGPSIYNYILPIAMSRPTDVHDTEELNPTPSTPSTPFPQSPYGSTVSLGSTPPPDLVPAVNKSSEFSNSVFELVSNASDPGSFVTASISPSQLPAHEKNLRVRGEAIKDDLGKTEVADVEGWDATSLSVLTRIRRCDSLVDNLIQEAERAVQKGKPEGAAPGSESSEKNGWLRLQMNTSDVDLQNCRKQRVLKWLSLQEVEADLTRVELVKEGKKDGKEMKMKRRKTAAAGKVDASPLLRTYQAKEGVWQSAVRVDIEVSGCVVL